MFQSVIIKNNENTKWYH